MGDLLSSSGGDIFKIKLPLEYTEAKKKQVEKQLSLNKANGDQTQMPYINLKIKKLWGAKTYFGSSPENYIEGVRFDPEVYGKYNLRIAMHRIKTLIAKFSLWMDKVDDVINFKYPLFSSFVLMVRV